MRVAPRSFTKWEQLSSRELLPTGEQSELHAMPKVWEMEGSHDMTIKEDEQRDLPLLFDAKRRASVGLMLNPRAGADSPLRALSMDLIAKVCGSLAAKILIDMSQGVLDEHSAMANMAMVKEHRAASGQSMLLHTVYVASDALMLKAEAGAAFSRRDYNLAANLYAQALGAIVPDCASEEDTALKVVLHSNLAEACLRVSQFSAAAHHAAEALKLDPAHDKSTRRLARALQR